MAPNINYQQLAAALLSQQAGAPGMRMKAAPSSTPTTYWGHGDGGLFSYPGLSQKLFSAMLLPKIGLQSQLPVNWNNETNPIFGIVTGVTDTTGDEPTGVCDDPPVAGLSKLCMHSFVFGRYSRMTRVFNVDRAGEITNRGEFSDFRLIGDPFAGAGAQAIAPSIPGAEPAQIARNEIAKALFELAVSWSRDFAKQVYNGNPTNNTAGGGYKEFYGLDTLINTGYRDAETGVACPAADSIVRSFGDILVENNGSALVAQVTNIMRNLRHLAYRANLNPATWKVSMTYNLFYQITEIWPCVYLSYRCNTVGSSSTQFLDSGVVENMRNDMRGDLENYTGQYLLVDGQKIPVTIDDAIDETENQDGTFTSDIYFIPMTVIGGEPVTFFEYFNFDSPGGAMEMARLMAPQDSYYTSDGGRFLWHKKPPTNTCVQMLSITRPRLMLLTPYLAARLTDCRCEPLEHERSPFPDSAYFVDGGGTDRLGYGPSYYTPTA